MRRIIFVAAGLLLVTLAFIEAAQVADTRDGLIAEVITLFSGLGGVSLLLYGLVPRRRDTRPTQPVQQERPRTRRTANDLLLGAGGVVLAVALLSGLAYSGGWGWAALGGVLLVPMTAGSAYLLIAFARAKDRDWTLDLSSLFRAR